MMRPRRSVYRTSARARMSVAGSRSRATRSAGLPTATRPAPASAVRRRAGAVVSADRTSGNDGVNPAKIEDPVHRSLGLLRARELGQARGQQIEGATIHGDEAPTGQHDLWTRDLSALDPSSQGERIRGQGAGVDDADDSPARQHG